MELSNPLIIRFEKGSGKSYQKDNILTVPAFSRWNDFKDDVSKALSTPDIDYVALSYREVGDDLNKSEVLKTLDIKTSHVLKESKNQGLRAFNRFNNKLYFLNPSFDEQKLEGKDYYVQDVTVLSKRDQFPTSKDWEKHQSDILKKFQTTMGLTEGKYFESSNHKALLLDPSRGLSDDQLDEYFSWKPYQTIVPELMGDDMVGIPAVSAKAYEHLTISVNGQPLSAAPLTLETTGHSGIMIPMKNAHGDAAKYQVSADITKGNFTLKARALDGVSIKTSEFTKGKGHKTEYTFTIDGKPSELKVVEASNDGARMSDIKGEFSVGIKEDIKPKLESRGYEIPEFIDTLKTVPSAKYVWMAQGNMAGSNNKNLFNAQTTEGKPLKLSQYYKESNKGNASYTFKIDGKDSNMRVKAVDDDRIYLHDIRGEFDIPIKGDAKPVLEQRGYTLPDKLESFSPVPQAKNVWNAKSVIKHVSPSNAGFITAREPKNGRDDYLTLVVEGALKGMIVSDYIDKPDVNGVSLADTIDSTGERGIVVAQVSGTAFAFTKSVDYIYDEKNIAGTYIAFDADGRDNFNVAKGIHQAYDHLGKKSPVKVLQWNPKQKGLDDALIALANHDIEMNDMEISYGKPETLFPLDQAAKPNPYKLDGTKEYGGGWQKDWEKQKAERNAKAEKALDESTNINVDLDLSDLSQTDSTNMSQ